MKKIDYPSAGPIVIKIGSQYKMSEDYHPSPIAHAFAYVRLYGKVLKPLAYSNEVGEAIRNVAPKLLIPAYALSFGYVGLDIAHNVHKYYEQYGWTKPTHDALKYYSVWHGTSSLLFPTLVVGQTVHQTQRLVRHPRLNLRPFTRQWAPVITALSIIPFVIGPIDTFTTKVIMEPLFGKHLVDRYGEHEHGHELDHESE